MDIALTADMLRTAIRAKKLRVGTRRQVISVLVQKYAPDGARTIRADGSVYRLPVEIIPQERRIAFLGALNGLPEQHANGATIIAQLDS